MYLTIDEREFEDYTMEIESSFLNPDGNHNNIGEIAAAAVESTMIDPILLSTKRVVFVGGVPAAATIPMIRAAMIPFGNIQSVDMVRTILHVLGLSF